MAIDPGLVDVLSRYVGMQRLWRCNLFWLAYALGEGRPYRHEVLGPLPLEVPHHGSRI